MTPSADPIPVHTYVHTEAAFRPFHFALNHSVPAGTVFHVCTASFRLFHGLRLEAVKRLESGEALPVNTDASGIVRHRMRQSLGCIAVDQELPAGEIIDVTLNPHGRMISTAGDLEWDLRLAVIKDEEFEPDPCRFPFHDLADPIEIRLIADQAERLEAIRRFNGDLVIRTADTHGITAPCPGSTVAVEGPGIREEHPLPESGTLTLQISPEITAPLCISVKGAFTTTSNPLPRTHGGQAVYFGDIHWHTASSTDGQRDMAKALQSARDELGLDFAGPSEHILDEGDYGRSTVRDQERVCRAYDQPGSFAVIPGFELSRTYGHCNVYTSDFSTLIDLSDKFEDEFAPILKSGTSRFTVEELCSLFSDPDTLVVPHHSNMDNAVGKGPPGSVPAWTAFHWPKQPIPQHLRLIEMTQQRGAFESERPDPDWQPPFWLPFHGGLGGSAETALARGHRIGFTGGTDNHHGWPSLEGNGGLVGGVTGVLADGLTPASIVRALHARRCYATTGARIVAEASLNGQWIGSELELSPRAPRDFRISLKGTAPWETVELISFGQIAHAFDLPSSQTELELEWSDLRPERPVEEVYYYIRARQQDGHLIWMSPWWIDLKETE